MAKASKRSNDPYVILAETLNLVPNGFPAVEDGTHLKVLKWIFKPEEALLASKLKLPGETIKKLSKRLKMPACELTERLDSMFKKGQVRVFRNKKGKHYALLPFVPGIYEDQINRNNKELVLLMEDYFKKSRGDIVFTSDPPIFRVIPVKQAIKTDLKVHPHSEATTIILNAKSWGIRKCTCRVHQGLIDNRCEYPISVCIETWNEENAFDFSNTTKPITMQEALDYLKEAQDAGLIHTSMNVASGHPYICNCCVCCCNVFRAVNEFGRPNAFVKSDYILSLEETACSGCGECVDRCQLKLLEIKDDKCVVDDTCIGCGVCVLVCPEEALSLVPRKAKEIKKPPKNLIFWMLRRAFKRKINPFKLI
ncbi:MAG: 4Fe-4S binding protein [Candidatus Heimdallarchaeota archaeon]|nr:4Fe-4S binding protein [Candidatus Heimdallarchaeota archaeon]